MHVFMHVHDRYAVFIDIHTSVYAYMCTQRKTNICIHRKTRFELDSGAQVVSVVDSA